MELRDYCEQRDGDAWEQSGPVSALGGEGGKGTNGPDAMGVVAKDIPWSGAGIVFIVFECWWKIRCLDQFQREIVTHVVPDGQGPEPWRVSLMYLAVGWCSVGEEIDEIWDH